ncbi:MAG: glycosyl hydrolase family 28 protein [Bacteroidia bacterium]
MSGGARYIFAENCSMDSPNLDRALRIKTNKVRGGTVEHIYFRNSTVGQVREAVVRINMRYPIYSDTSQTYMPVIHDIYVDNISSKKSRYGLLIDGYNAKYPVKDVFLKNCNFDGVEEGNSVEFGENLVFENCIMNGKPMDSPTQ